MNNEKVYKLKFTYINISTIKSIQDGENMYAHVSNYFLKS